MSKKSRDYLFFCFILIFIVGTITISLYASGYKLKLDWPPKFNRLLIKTGMIAVDSSPRGATIYLNGQPQTNFSLNPYAKNYLVTATKIKNVLPGEYDLRLELDGYLPLNKKISVYSGQTTFAENINLFRADLPFLITTATSSDLALSANYKYLFVTTLGKIITLKNDQNRILPLVGTPGQWLKNEDKILIKGWLFAPEKNNDFNYNQLIGEGATDWYNEENTGRLYYQSKNSLAYLDPNNKTSYSVVSGENYLTYEPRGDNLFFVATSNGRTTLKKYSLKTQKIEQEMPLPTVGQYLFRSDGRPLLVLYDDQNKTLYLINPDNLGGSRTIANAVSWQWLSDDTLLYNNNWEIYLFDLKQTSASLLTRIGEKIVKIIWNANNNYLLFSTADSLNAYDFKIGLITRLFQAEKIASPVLDQKNNTLYFWAKIGQQEGIYGLLLQ